VQDWIFFMGLPEARSCGNLNPEAMTKKRLNLPSVIGKRQSISTCIILASAGYNRGAPDRTIPGLSCLTLNFQNKSTRVGFREGSSLMSLESHPLKAQK
jgi:hypothetical protein